jgi:hypothetical protein
MTLPDVMHFFNHAILNSNGRFALCLCIFLGFKHSQSKYLNIFSVARSTFHLKCRFHIQRTGHFIAPKGKSADTFFVLQGFTIGYNLEGSEIPCVALGINTCCYSTISIKE